MYVCSCFGITEQQVREHAESGACTPRQIASASKAGTDCGGCVRRIQALLGRGTCPRRELIDQGAPEPLGAEPSDEAAAGTDAGTRVPYDITPHATPDAMPGALPEAA
ncbi:iron-sulfur binding protein [Streptomyces sp. CB02923]|uniref:(2Fe-2S)-binding protein n=1 Tax=Streptomyces sp. CB02923 TaxID=1718985 RepID=UPI00093C4E76|nr:(2Fe-2S)-binding protein [Streptomyces sp. CB02923]OKI05196.1 iron-sulfur binding protein [Streptomyces sp. CB02923]